MSYTHLRRAATKLKEDAESIMWHGNEEERAVAKIVEHTCEFILGEEPESPLPKSFQKSKLIKKKKK